MFWNHRKSARRSAQELLQLPHTEERLVKAKDKWNYKHLPNTYWSNLEGAQEIKRCWSSASRVFAWLILKHWIRRKKNFDLKMRCPLCLANTLRAYLVYCCQKNMIKVICTPERDKVAVLLLLCLFSVPTHDHEKILESKMKTDIRFINNLMTGTDCPIHRVASLGQGTASLTERAEPHKGF